MRHVDLSPDQRSVALTVAQRALAMARGLSTARPGNVFIPNGDGTGTWIGGDGLGNGAVAPWIGDTTIPGRPLGISASSSGGVLVASWGGELEGGVPEDFGHVTIFASLDGDVTALGDLTVAGSVSTGEYVGGDVVEVWAVAYDLARSPATGALEPNESGESERVTVEVVDLSSEAMEVAGAVGQHFWADDAGVHVSTDEKDAEGESNVLMNALGILLRAASRNLVSVTPSGFAVYDESGREVAQLNATSSQIGPSDGGNTVVSPAGMLVRSGPNDLARFASDAVELGMNSDSSRVIMCGGALTIRVGDPGTGGEVRIDADDSSLVPDVIISTGTSRLGSLIAIRGDGIEMGTNVPRPCVSVNGKYIDGATLLWSGTWSSGTITVPNAHVYDMFLIRVGGANEMIVASENSGQVNGVGGCSWGVNLNGQQSTTALVDREVSVVGFRATVSNGDRWTLVGLTRVNVSSNFGYAVTGVTAIYGVG